MKPFKPPVARVTRAIIATTVTVQLLIALLGVNAGTELVMRAALIPARLMGMMPRAPDSVPAVLTLLTSLFLHMGWLHLLLNLVFLAWVGRLVEWAIGPVRLLALYAVSGVAGGVLQTILQPDPTVPVVGASGAVAGVFACYAMLFARQRAPARRLWGLELSSEAMTAIWFAAVWIGLQLITGMVMNGNIAIWSHIGGFIAGLVFAQPFVQVRQAGG